MRKTPAHPPPSPDPSCSGVPVRVFKGRGAVSNLAHRFAVDTRLAFDDGWHAPVVDPDAIESRANDQDTTPTDDPFGTEAPPLRTEVRLETARSAITANASPDVPFERSINPYRGCEHGCIYCFARPTHSYLNLSPGLDFETRLVAKQNMAELLRAELAAQPYVPKGIVVGTVTDAYQPVERELRLTREVIEVLAEARHPFSIITKSSGVERDLDLIAPAAARGLAAVYVTVTTLDAQLARSLEPRAAAPARRLRTIRALAEAGVPVGVSVAPQIPFVNDDMEQVLEAARDAGARSAFYTVLRLPWEVAPLFTQWLHAHVPDRAERVLARVRDLHGGRDYRADWGRRMQGEGVWADLLGQRFERACRRLGYTRERSAVDASQFRPPGGQGRLF